MSTNNITELNKLIYAGAKLICAKIGVSLKDTIRNSKPGREIRLETLIRNLRQQKNEKAERKSADGTKRKSNPTIKTNDVTRGRKSEGTYKKKKKKKKGRLKRY